MLIVDDEKYILNSLKRQLEEYEVELITESNPLRAKEIIKNNHIDLLMTDQRMPEMTGIELIIYAKEISPKTISILMTAYTDFDVIISAINEGKIFHYLTKPWKYEELEELLKKAIKYKVQQDQKSFILSKYFSDKQLWIDNVKMLESKLMKGEDNVIQAFQRIIEVKDNNLYLHSLRVSNLSVRFANFIGVDKNRMEIIKYAGIFHDIGKVLIKDRIIYKETKLNEDENMEMMKHPVIGAEILRQFDSFNEIASVVEQHHERENGMGYPYGLAGDNIKLEARIISIADAYDALTSDRVYRKGIDKGEAIKILTSNGAGIFDENLLKQFVRFTCTEDFEEYRRI